MTDCGAKIRVLIADDQALVRTGFKMLIDSADDLMVVGTASTGVETIALVRELLPDVVLMDIRMPEMDGIEATQRIADDPELAGVRVLVLTTFELDEYIFEALHAGASGFLLKDTDPDDLLDAVRIIANGESLLAPRVTRRLIAEYISRPTTPTLSADALEPLTDREREIVMLVGRGLSNAEIAAELFISPATAKTHVSHAMLKLQARDRAQLVVVAYETGLVSPGSPGEL
ncbi:MAG: response regulator transcription factor [Actinobacteria bacterium]|nr:MAG: response regulator transcription factor [Actinomycetota bacterium]